MFEICKYSVWISYLNLLWSANPVTLWIDFISSSNSFENNITHFNNILQFPPTYQYMQKYIYLITSYWTKFYRLQDGSYLWECWTGIVSLCIIIRLSYLTTVHLLAGVTNALGQATQYTDSGNIDQCRTSGHLHYSCDEIFLSLWWKLWKVEAHWKCVIFVNTWTDWQLLVSIKYFYI